jgi:hypothetical protein
VIAPTPAWAQRRGLPSGDDVEYVRDLIAAILLVAALVWIVGSVATGGPRALVRIARKQVGG